MAAPSAPVVPGWLRQLAVIHPGPRRLQELGNDWLDRARTAVLRVPSALVPTESNFLVNPLHPAFAELRVVRSFKFSFDERFGTRS